MRRQGWTIVAHRFRSGHRDVDLVMRRGDEVAFVGGEARVGRRFGCRSAPSASKAAGARTVGPVWWTFGSEASATVRRHRSAHFRQNVRSHSRMPFRWCDPGHTGSCPQAVFFVFYSGLGPARASGRFWGPGHGGFTPYDGGFHGGYGDDGRQAQGPGARSRADREELRQGFDHAAGHRIGGSRRGHSHRRDQSRRSDRRGRNPAGSHTEIYGPSRAEDDALLARVANAQRLGGVAAFIDAEHALDTEYAKKLGVDVENS